MIISRTPLRISLGGGGTDLPSYYQNNGGGFLVAAAITKYIYISVHENFADEFMVKYSQIEVEKSIDDLKHPLIREAIKLTNPNGFLEISSLADIPAGTGLGSSGTFTVGLLKALNAFNKNYISNYEIANDACLLEIEVLNESVGKQDQFISAIGGLTAFEFNPDGCVKPTSIRISQTYLAELEENLLLFYTGIQRSASDELSAMDKGVSLNNPEIKENLNDVRKAGYRSAEVLENGDLELFATLLTNQWKLKFQRSPHRVHQEINEWIKFGLSNGALGGKLIGAGGGGFILFFAKDKTKLRKSMQKIGLREVPFNFDFQGSVILQ